MNDDMRSILLDFITVYLHDRKDKSRDEYIEQELGRLYLECEVNSTILIDKETYGDV